MATELENIIHEYDNGWPFPVSHFLFHPEIRKKIL